MVRQKHTSFYRLVAIDASHLYAGAYNLACIVTADDGTRYRSSNSTFTVLRDAKGEYKSYLADLQTPIVALLGALNDIYFPYIDVLLRLTNGPNDVRAEAKQMCIRNAAMCRSIYSRILSGLTKVPIPLGVPRDLHPKIMKAFEQYMLCLKCNEQAWLAEATRIDMMDWVNDHWEYNQDRIISQAVSLANASGAGAYQQKNFKAWHDEGEKNRLSALSTLNHLGDRL